MLHRLRTERRGLETLRSPQNIEKSSSSSEASWEALFCAGAPRELRRGELLSETFGDLRGELLPELRAPPPNELRRLRQLPGLFEPSRADGRRGGLSSRIDWEDVRSRFKPSAAAQTGLLLPLPPWPPSPSPLLRPSLSLPPPPPLPRDCRKSFGEEHEEPANKEPLVRRRCSVGVMVRRQFWAANSDHVIQTVEQGAPHT